MRFRKELRSQYTLWVLPDEQCAGWKVSEDQGGDDEPRFEGFGTEGILRAEELGWRWRIAEEGRTQEGFFDCEPTNGVGFFAPFVVLGQAGWQVLVLWGIRERKNRSEDRPTAAHPREWPLRGLGVTGATQTLERRIDRARGLG